MQRVGEHLEAEAIKRRSKSEDLDLFGRSAFNRYYYATFLLTRAMLTSFRPAWRGGHAGLPDELRGWVSKELKKAKVRAEDLGDRAGAALCATAIHHAHELADLLSLAYDARVVADYQPEERVAFDASQKMKMGQIEMTKAKHWPHAARVFISSIERAWKLSNVT